MEVLRRYAEILKLRMPIKQLSTRCVFCISVYLCVYVCVRMYVCVCVWMCVCAYVCMYVRAFVCVYVYEHFPRRMLEADPRGAEGAEMLEFKLTSATSFSNNPDRDPIR